MAWHSNPEVAACERAARHLRGARKALSHVESIETGQILEFINYAARGLRITADQIKERNQ